MEHTDYDAFVISKLCFGFLSVAIVKRKEGENELTQIKVEHSCKETLTDTIQRGRQKEGKEEGEEENRNDEKRE